MAEDGAAGVGGAGKVLVAKAGKGLAAQRAKTAPQHQAVPGDALSRAGAPVKGGAPAVGGAAVTAAGRGLLVRGGQKGPPA